jgi:hypothetical protein
MRTAQAHENVRPDVKMIRSARLIQGVGGCRRVGCPVCSGLSQGGFLRRP